MTFSHVSSSGVCFLCKVTREGTFENVLKMCAWYNISFLSSKSSSRFLLLSSARAIVDDSASKRCSSGRPNRSTGPTLLMATTDITENLLHNTIRVVDSGLFATTQGVTDPNDLATNNRIGDEVNIRGLSIKFLMEMPINLSDVTIYILASILCEAHAHT
jgi:hypothetical protein